VVQDFDKHPENWEKTGEHTEDAGKKYPGGKVTEETFRNKESGEEVERQTIRGPNGQPWHTHLRVK
jgi:hypothetical protein